MAFSPTIAVPGRSGLIRPIMKVMQVRPRKVRDTDPNRPSPQRTGPAMRRTHPLGTSTAVSDVTTLTADQDFVIVRKKYVSSTMPGL